MPIVTSWIEPAGNHVTHVVRGNSGPFSVDGRKPECSTLIERHALEVSF